MVYYAKKVEEVFKHLKTSENGLTKEEVEKRLKQYGYNELKKEEKATLVKLFLDQFKNALIILLIFASFLALLLGDILEAVAMFSIVLLNVILGFVQEYKAEKAVEALEKMSAPTAEVLREGNEQKIATREVVPGDILLLEAGNILAADTRLINTESLKIDESSLTGESIPSEKVTNPLKPETSVADQENMAFMGTIVMYGKGRGIVTATGMQTEFGKIAHSLQTTKTVKTPLLVKFEQLAKQIGIIAISLILMVFIAGAIQGQLSMGKMVLFALALIVSTVPNSLPVVVTVGLSVGTTTLAKQNMLIKKLPAAESLGAATIICSDKTGTITKDQMTVTEIFYDNKKIDVSGAGYVPSGNFYFENKQIDPKELELLFRVGALCNNAKIVKKEDRFEILGDPTEGALVVLAKKGKLDKNELQEYFKFIEELPFDPERKRMSVIYRNKKDKETEAYVKGAPDILLKLCDRIIKDDKIAMLTNIDRKKILAVNNFFAEKALRVLALAYRGVPTSREYSLDGVEKNLIFVGLVGMIDPPREGVNDAVKQCNEAGINVMVITGDHAITAKAVAKQIGLFNEGDIVLTGEELQKMKDAELEKKIDKIRIVARALPIQKLRIVEILQKQGHIVAMTGDGVNDAPALKKADIGIAMGITGTDVAKEVAEATLVDDNFATIVNAVAEGRNIYDKMIKSARYLLSCNAGEITSVFMAIMLGFPLPLLPLQLLLMNLLTDDFPALGLGLETAEEGIMKRMPRDPKKKPITKKTWGSIILFGLVMGAGTLLMFTLYKDIDLAKARTMAFTTLVMFQMFAVMSSRSLNPFKKLNIFTNKWLFMAILLSIVIQMAVVYWPVLQPVFGTVALLKIDWFRILAVSSLGFIGMEIGKFFIEIGAKTIKKRELNKAL